MYQKCLKLSFKVDECKSLPCCRNSFSASKLLRRTLELKATLESASSHCGFKR